MWAPRCPRPIVPRQARSRIAGPRTRPSLSLGSPCHRSVSRARAAQRGTRSPWSGAASAHDVAWHSPAAQTRHGWQQNYLQGSSYMPLHQDPLKSVGKGVLTGGVVRAMATRRHRGEYRRAMDEGVRDELLQLQGSLTWRGTCQRHKLGTVSSKTIYEVRPTSH
jgi:hypothetical protein